MPLRNRRTIWNKEPVVWYIVYRNIELSYGKKEETLDAQDADDEVQEMCDQVSKYITASETFRSSSCFTSS